MAASGAPRNPEIGEFTCRVRVRLWQDQPDDDSMGIDQIRDEGIQAWGRIEPVGAILFYGTPEVKADVTHRLSTWRTPALNARKVTGAHVVEWAGMRYRVRRATDLDLGGAFVLVDLEQLGLVDG